MSNFDTVVLDGEMGLFTTIREGDLPYYTGATEVTPSDQTQTLPTADTIVTSNITINPVPGEYIDTTDATLDDASLLPSGVTAYADGVKYTGTAAINDDGDLVVSGDTVTVPAGFYEEPAAASVESGSATTPATTITANPSISVGNDGSITASVSATQSVTPSVTAGYVSSGTAGTITVSGSGSSQLSTQAGATITPSTSQQTAVAAGKFTTGAVIVDAMPSGTAGTPTATKGTVSNHSVAVTPSVTNTTGYIIGDTKTGTAVTVDVTELESGTKSITENGTGISVSGYSAVDVNVSGGGETERKQVAFFDYDGTITNTYTKEEFAALTELPANPSHAGLTAQGWNWSLSDAKAYLTSYPNADMNIGQMYRTTSGATEIDITLGSDFLKPYLVIAVNGTVDVDWGDNSAHSTLTGTSLTAMKNVLHTYASSGDYTISLFVTSGEFTLNNGSGNAALLSWTTSVSTNRTYSGAIKAIRFGQGIQTIGGAKNLQSVEYITIPNTVTDVGIFENDWSLKHITIPSGVTTLAISAFNENWKLKSISIPNSVTTINGSSFNGCVELKSVTLPSAVTVSGGSIFAYCHSLRNVVLPNSITTIPSTMFRENYEIEEYTVPSFITGLNQGCFRTDRNMKSVTLPEGLTTIAQDVFFDCKNLRSITIPSTVTSIGSLAFYNCVACNEYHFKSTTPPELSASNVFNGESLGTTIYVPVGCLTDYQTATNYPTASGTIYVEE